MYNYYAPIKNSLKMEAEVGNIFSPEKIILSSIRQIIWGINI
jgi:hypothetical protein